ncbi:MAG: YncE family protein [Alphaproteobacteria bacterium]|nr:YncE family protein [Alphaproteobacteria bacterium]
MHKWMKVAAFVVVTLTLSATAAFATDASPLPLKRVADIRLSGDTSRFDYQSVDAADHRLFISHMGAGAVVVFDTAARHEITDLKGFPGATGITFVPSLDRVFVSVTGHWWNSVIGGGEVAAIDAKTLKTIWKTQTGRFPDGSVFVPGADRLYVSDESGNQELVLDAMTGHLLATIALEGEAGMSAFDPVSGQVLVNVQTRNEIAVIDPAINGITRQYALPAYCHNNHGLLIDAPSRRAYVACDGNAKLLVFDFETLRVTQAFDVGNEPDVLALDPVRHRLYVASESGVVAAFDTASLTIAKLGEGYAGNNAHSIAVDPSTGLVYLPIRNLNGYPALHIMKQIQQH